MTKTISFDHRGSMSRFFWSFEFWLFEIVSKFEIRISDLRSQKLKMQLALIL
jgi:hypothetical protein